MQENRRDCVQHGIDLCSVHQLPVNPKGVKIVAWVRVTVGTFPCNSRRGG